MREYPKRVKQLIRKYAAQAYEAELGLALGELEQQFAIWRSGQIGAGELSDRVHAFTRGPARELWGRYNARIDDMQVAHAIVAGILPRDAIPTELLDALLPIIALYEQGQAAPDQGETLDARFGEAE
ncbi:hypothetical protein EKD04_014940 [Chloroflexales bacterium ZM16-3]|nr:hypothetical protein [Chloroflexales bacterium ZM16-3]